MGRGNMKDQYEGLMRRVNGKGQQDGSIGKVTDTKELEMLDG